MQNAPISTVILRSVYGGIGAFARGGLLPKWAKTWGETSTDLVRVAYFSLARGSLQIPGILYHGCTTDVRQVAPLFAGGWGTKRASRGHQFAGFSRVK